MEQKQVQAIQHIDQTPMMSNQQTVAHQPEKFILDFKSVYPQYTPDNKETIVINHKVVLMDPFSAKKFLKVLHDNLERYEKKFGEIKKSSQQKKAEKELKKIEEREASGTDTPIYMG